MELSVIRDVSSQYLILVKVTSSNYGALKGHKRRDNI